MKVSWLLKSLAAGAAGTAVLGGLPEPAQAAPHSIAKALNGEARAASNVETIAYQVCRWRFGARQCRWVADRPRTYYGPSYSYGPTYDYRRSFAYGPGYYYGPGYGYNPGNLPPEAYPTGSTRWWREMDREGRGGQAN